MDSAITDTYVASAANWNTAYTDLYRSLGSSAYAPLSSFATAGHDHTGIYYSASNPSNYIPLTALSSTATGLTYTNTTGVFSLTAGYAIPTTSNISAWNALVTMAYPGVGIPLSTGSAWGTSITDNSANWNTAYTDRLKWDGGATGLVPSTGRTSLGLGTAALKDTTFFERAIAADGNTKYRRSDNTWQPFPTFNQSTTGSAAKWTTSRRLYGHWIDGSANMDSAITDPYISSATAWNAKVTFPGFGTTHLTAAYGDHNHTSVYEPFGSIVTAMDTHTGTYAHANIANGQTAYGWGNHASQGYITSSGSITGSAIYVKSATTTGVLHFTGMSALSIRQKTVRNADDTMLELGGSYSPTGTWTLTNTVFAGTKADLSAIDSVMVKIRPYDPITYNNSKNAVSQDTYRDIQELTHPPGSEIIYKVTTTLSAAEINSLYTSPKTVIAAPGSGYAIQIISASVFLDYLGDPYGTFVDLELYESGAATQFWCASLLDATADKFRLFLPTASSYTTILENQPLLIKVGTNDPDSGTSTAKLYITYRIITL
jgi:hypothetical protein